MEKNTNLHYVLSAHVTERQDGWNLLLSCLANRYERGVLLLSELPIVWWIFAIWKYDRRAGVLVL